MRAGFYLCYGMPAHSTRPPPRVGFWTPVPANQAHFPVKMGISGHPAPSALRGGGVDFALPIPKPDLPGSRVPKPAHSTKPLPPGWVCTSLKRSLFGGLNLDFLLTFTGPGKNINFLFTKNTKSFPSALRGMSKFVYMLAFTIFF